MNNVQRKALMDLTSWSGTLLKHLTDVKHTVIEKKVHDEFNYDRFEHKIKARE